jgi:hypothetical protein
LDREGIQSRGAEGFERGERGEVPLEEEDSSENEEEIEAEWQRVAGGDLSRSESGGSVRGEEIILKKSGGGGGRGEGELGVEGRGRKRRRNERWRLRGVEREIQKRERKREKGRESDSDWGGSRSAGGAVSSVRGSGSDGGRASSRYSDYYYSVLRLLLSLLDLLVQSTNIDT